MLAALRASGDAVAGAAWPTVLAVLPVPASMLLVLLPLLAVLPPLSIEVLRSEAQPASASSAQASKVFFIFMMISVMRASARIVWSSDDAIRFP
jgi:hypothetical protein